MSCNYDLKSGEKKRVKLALRCNYFNLKLQTLASWQLNWFALNTHWHTHTLLAANACDGMGLIDVTLCDIYTQTPTHTRLGWQGGTVRQRMWITRVMGWQEMGRKGDAIRSNQQKGKANYIGDNARFADFLSVKLTALIDDRLCFQHLGLCYYTPRAPSQTSPPISCNLLYIKAGETDVWMLKSVVGGCKLMVANKLVPN